MSEIPDFPVEDRCIKLDDDDFPVCILVERIFQHQDSEGNTVLRFDGPKAIRLDDGTPDGIRSFPVFTDRPAAEQFVAEHKLQHQVMEIPNRQSLILVLEGVKKDKTVLAVVPDPLRKGFRVRPIPIDQAIRNIYGK